MSQTVPNRRFLGLGILPIAIIVLVIVTAVLHLVLGLSLGGHAGGPPPIGSTAGAHVTGTPPAGMAGASTAGGANTASTGQHRGGGRPGGSAVMMLLPLPLPTLFDLNFLGYIVLGAALYLPFLRRYQPIVRWLLILYTAVTVILWYLISSGHGNTNAYVDKGVEIALIVLLLIDTGLFRPRRAAAQPQ